MELNGFEKIANNCDVLIQIYKQLKFQDQLRLSRASIQLENIFREFIWKHKYRVMRIQEVCGTGRVKVDGEIGMSPLTLQAKEFEEFFRYYADYIEDLTLVGKLKCIAGVFLRNLKKFTYHGIFIQPDDIKMMIKNWPKLQKLELIGEFMLMPQGKLLTKKDPGYLRARMNHQLKFMSPWEALRRLCVEQANKNVLEYKYFRQLLSDLQLTCLKLNSIVEPPQEEYMHANEIAEGREQQQDEESPSLSLRQLDIETTFVAEKWSIHFPSFLNIFDKLTALSIKFCHQLTEDTLATLRMACKNLKKLTIHDTTFGDNINACQLPTQLTELTLNICQNVTGAHLKDMLTQGHIVKFRSRRTYFKEFEDFKISPHLLVLDTDGINSLEFRSAFEDNPNLKELTWHGPFYGENANDGSFQESSLQTCINLEVLNTLHFSIPITPILQLTKLRQLFISESSKFFKWSYITDLLSHPSLRELTIDRIIYRSVLWEQQIPPVADFHTNIQLITMDVRTFQATLKFWLDLLGKNVDLKLVCNNFECNNQRFVEHIINHESFPSDIRTIEVWGATESCNEIRRKGLQAWPDKRKEELVLCRKLTYVE